MRPTVGPAVGPLARPAVRASVGPVVRPPMGPVVRPPMGPVVRAGVRLTGRPPPTAGTDELPRRSPISGEQAAESLRGARGGGHSSSWGSAKSRRGGRGGCRAPDNRVHGGDPRRPGGGRRPPRRRPPSAAQPRRRPPPAAAPPARPPPRGPPGRRRVARPAAAPTAASARVAARWPTRWPPAFCGAERRRPANASRRRGPAMRPGVARTPHRRLARNLPRSPHVDRVLRARLPAEGPAALRGGALRGPARSRRRARRLWRARQPAGADDGPPGPSPDSARSTRRLRASVAEVRASADEARQAGARGRGWPVPPARRARMRAVPSPPATRGRGRAVPSPPATRGRAVPSPPVASA